MDGCSALCRLHRKTSVNISCYWYCHLPLSGILHSASLSESQFTFQPSQLLNWTLNPSLWLQVLCSSYRNFSPGIIQVPGSIPIVSCSLCSGVGGFAEVPQIVGGRAGLSLPGLSRVLTSTDPASLASIISAGQAVGPGDPWSTHKAASFSSTWENVLGCRRMRVHDYWCNLESAVLKKKKKREKQIICVLWYMACPQ